MSNSNISWYLLLSIHGYITYYIQFAKLLRFSRQDNILQSTCINTIYLEFYCNLNNCDERCFNLHNIIMERILT